MVQRSRRGGCRGVGVLAGMSLALALWPATAPGQYARYVEAYNVLAQAVNERNAACGGGGQVPKVAPGGTLTGAGMQKLRASVLNMLEGSFVVDPADWNLDAFDATNAFPLAVRRDAKGTAIGRHLMEEVGDRHGRFTQVPKEYTASGETLYSATSWQEPVLWVHFEELETVLKRMRFTTLQDTATTAWMNPYHEITGHGGWAPGADWAQALRDAWTSYAAGGGGPASDRPESSMLGLGARQGWPYYASMRTQAGRYVISGLYTGVTRRVTLCLRASKTLQENSVPDSANQFDSCGMSLHERGWVAWSTLPSGTQDPLVSPLCGGQAAGNCAAPGWGQKTGRGYIVDNTRGCVKWDFSPIALTRPEEEADTDDDGLCATGCECTSCLPAADPVWSEMRAASRVRLPLGLSSGVLTGGLRLKAYLTEYTVNGATQQMFSLNTAVLWSVGDSSTSNMWEFAAVKRPSGAEVLFSRYGAKASRAVESIRKYRLRWAGDYQILSFPSSGGKVCEHKFSYRGLNFVTMKVGTTEIVAEGDARYGQWPGLQATFSGGRLQRVDSPALAAVPTRYEGSLVRAVELRYRQGDTKTISFYGGGQGASAAGKAGRTQNDTNVVKNAADSGGAVIRGFRTVNTAGQIVSDVRIVERPETGSVEIWRGITSGAEPSALLKTCRRKWLDAESGCRMLAETTLVNDGMPDADSRVTITAMAAFPWGEETVSRTVAYGLPEAQTTRYTYGTNELETATYGQLSLEEEPDGRWTAYQYDGSGRACRVRSPWRSSRSFETNACRVTEYFYAGDSALAALGYPAEIVTNFDDRPRLTVERLGGCEVARRYAVYTQACEVAKECLNPGAAYDDPGNRTTVTRFMTTSPFVGRPASIEHPDGTRTVYSYTTPGGGLTTTEDRGVGAGAAVTNGMRSVKVQDSLEQVVSETQIDIASGITNSATVYTRDALGRAVCTSNALTGETTVNIYGCCEPERVLDGAGVATDYAYDELKRPYAIERLGVTTFQAYEVGGQVTETRRSASGAADIVTRVEYDKAGQMQRSIDERGFATTSRVDTNEAGERVATTVSPDGATRVETYYLDGQVKSVSGTGVPPVTYGYGADEQGTFTIEYRGVDTNAAQWSRTTTDRLGRLRSVTQADGYTRTTEYDTLGRPVSEADGQTLTVFTQDALGRVSRQALDMDGNGVADAGGNDRMSESETGYGRQEGRPVRWTVTRVWDTAGSSQPRETARSLSSLDGRTSWSIAYGRTTRVDVVRQPATVERRETTVAADGTRTIALYTNGLLATEWRETAQGEPFATRRQSYDGYGHVSRVEDIGPGGATRVTTYGYDAAGNVTNATVAADGRALATASVYDAAGRRVREVLPDGGVVTREYEPGGALKAQSGTRAYPVCYGYDDQGRLAWQATYRWGSNGTPDLTRWTYDVQRGWLSERVYADGTTAAYDYYPNGSLRRRTSARGVAVDYAYDRAGAITNTSYTDGTQGVAIRRDRLGRAVEIMDGTGAHACDYQVDGRATGETFPLAGQRVDWAYDALGRRTNMTVNAVAGDGGAAAVGYDYDAAGRLAHVTQGAIRAGYRYGEDGGTVAGVTLGNSGSTVLSGARAYDGFGRVTNQEWTAGGAVVAGFGYGHDDAGRRTNCVLADGRRWTYAYDERGQVVTACLTNYENALEAGAWFEYGYDTIGNRTRMQANGKPTTYLANALNQYASFDLWGTGLVAHICGTVFAFGGSVPAMDIGVKLGGPVRAVPAYDADGNLVQMPDESTGNRDTGWKYAWDAENRLVGASNTQCWVAFRYDYMGRRVGKTVFANEAGTWVRSAMSSFVYDGWNMVQEVRSQMSEVRTNRYVWGLDLSGTFQGAGGIGGLLAVTFGGTTSMSSAFYVHDVSGNVMGLVDTNGTTVAHYEYDPFGNQTVMTGADSESNPFRFSTKYVDSETELSYYGYRYYSPTMGRWLSRDPIAERGGLHLYGFVNNSPLNSLDPLGLALYAFDGTWNDREKMQRPTNVAKLFGVYKGLRWYEKGVGTTWYTRLVGGATGAGGENRIESMYGKLVDLYSSSDWTGENQKIDVIGFSRGAALARTFVNYINSKGGVQLRGSSGKPTGVVCPVKIRFLGLFDTVASFGVPGNRVNWGQDLSIPPNVANVRHAVALDERRGMFPLSSVLSDPNHPSADPRIVEEGFPGAHSDIGGGYEDGDRSNFALVWMYYEALSVGVPFGPLAAKDMGVGNPIIHDERGRFERWRDHPREIYY